MQKAQGILRSTRMRYAECGFDEKGIIRCVTALINQKEGNVIKNMQTAQEF